MIELERTDDGIYVKFACNADLRYIQESLWHKSSKMAGIYTHVSTRNLSKIRSPLDIMGDERQ